MGIYDDKGAGNNGADTKDTGAKDLTPNKPRTTGFKNTTRRLREGKETRLSHRASLDWRLDRARVCEIGGAAADIASLGELQEILRQSRTGVMLLDEAEAAKMQIVYDVQTPASQYYPRPDKPVLSLNPHRPRGDLLNMLVRELRRAWQHRHGALVNPLNFEPDEAILVNRAQHADIFMISVKVAWELKLAGEQEAWDYLVGSPMADVSRTFEIKAQKDFRTLNNGEAARAAYDKVFEDSRTKALDKRVIHQMLLDESGYMKAKPQRPRLSMDLFRKLGEMPEGRNYLCISGARQPTDMCYSTVEDRSNANFLWFIKFERSFQEKELQMVKESVKLSAEIVDFAKWSRPGRSGETPNCRTSAMFEGLQDRRISFPLETLAGKPPRFASVEEKKRLFAGYIINVMRILDKSALGRALLSSACGNGLSVGLDALLEPSSSFFYPAQNHVDLGYQPDLLQKTEKGLSRYLVSFTGALRRAWHHHHGAGPDLSLAPETFLEYFRVAEADAEAVIHQVAWELRAQGAAFLWRHLLSGPQGDIALVFERVALENPNNVYNGDALKAAFNQWFAGADRTAAADHQALETIDLALITPDIFGNVGCRNLRREDIRRAGLLPNGANYLAGCLFTSAWYRGLACEINKTHLRHIELDIKKIKQNQHHIS